jgi:hypothetical protein
MLDDKGFDDSPSPIPPITVLFRDIRIDTFERIERVNFEDECLIAHYRIDNRGVGLPFRQCLFVMERDKSCQILVWHAVKHAEDRHDIIALILIMPLDQHIDA